MKQKLYKDTIHSFEVLSSSKNGAWILIRNKCHEQKLEVLTFDKIVEVDCIAVNGRVYGK